MSVYVFSGWSVGKVYVAVSVCLGFVHMFGEIKLDGKK